MVAGMVAPVSASITRPERVAAGQGRRPQEDTPREDRHGVPEVTAPGQEAVRCC